MSVKNCPSIYGVSCYRLPRIMDAWSGGVFATSLGARGSLLVWGGGHDNYLGNEIYAFDVATGLWSSLTNPVDPPACDVSTSTMVGGTNSPCAAETYDYLEFSRSTNEFFKLGSSSDDYSVVGTGNVHAFNVLTKTWRVATPFATWANPPSDDGEGATSAWDTIRNVLWWHGSWRAYETSNKTLRKYDPATNLITEYVGANVGIDGAMAYAGDLDALVLIDGRFNEQVYGFDLSSGIPVAYRLTISGTSDFPSTMGFDYDPIARKFVGYTSGSDVYTLTPPAGDWRTGTWLWATVAAGPGSVNPGAAAAHGTWGRFRYVPAMCGFIVVSNVSRPTYMYQLAGGDGSGCLLQGDAVDDTIIVRDLGPVTIPVGTNDTGFTDPVTVTVTTLPTQGTIGSISVPGPAAGMTITYTANIGATGTDRFGYVMTDGASRSDSATVSLEISLVPDTTPDQFYFVDRTSVPLNALVISDAIIVTGINAPAPISVVGGEYAIDGGTFTADAGSVGNGSMVSVQHTSAATTSATTQTALTVGGTTDVFSSTTSAGDLDTDGDGIPDGSDNCTRVANPNQFDADVDGYGNICDGDIDNSGLVTTADIGLLRSVLGQPAAFSAIAAAADLNDSGTVTTQDFGLLRAMLGTVPGPSGLHP